MNNLMVIEGYRAIIEYDPDIEMFRGEFTGLNGSADFYADSVEALRHEGGCRESSWRKPESIRGPGYSTRVVALEYSAVKGLAAPARIPEGRSP